MLSDKQNTYLCLHTNRMDTAVLEKKNNRSRHNNKKQQDQQKPLILGITDQASYDKNSLIISQFHHPFINPKRMKENQNRKICDKTKELKDLDHNHKYRNIVNKKAVAIIGDSTLSGIDQHSLSIVSFKVRFKNNSGARAEDICNHLKPEIRKKSDLVIIHTGTNDLTSNSKSLENSVRSKLPNCKLAISNVITRKDKNEIDRKVETFNIKLSKF